MMRRRELAGIVLASVALLTAPARAENEIGQVGFQFLTMGTGARVEALGAGTVLADGADALAWNPALTARISSPLASVSWFNWMTGVQAGHAAGLVPVARGAVGLTISSLSVSDFSNVFGEESIGESDLALAATGAYPLLGRLDGGGALRYIRSSLAGVDASGWAVDTGLNYRFVEGWNVGVAVRNMGASLSYGNGPNEPLPTRTALGAAGTLGELRVGAEGFRENGLGWRGALGAEYGLLDRLALRGGARLGEKQDIGVDPWSAGVGLRVRDGLELDYSFRNATFDASHRLGVRWALRGEAGGGAAGEDGDGAMTRSPREYYLNVLNEVIDQAIVDFPRGVSEKIVVRPASDHKAGSLIAETVAGRLGAAGFTAEARDPAREPPDTGDPENDARILGEMRDAGVLPEPGETALTFDIRESEYAILRQSRERWVGPRSVEREARVALDFELARGEQDEAMWTFQGSASASEQVAAHRIPKSAGYPKAAGTLAAPEGSLSPYLEPVIVGGIVSGLAVIFFANRDVGN